MDSALTGNALRSNAVPDGVFASSGCISLVTFFVQAKKVTRPYQSCFVQSRTVETGETMPPTLNGSWVCRPS